MRGLVALVAIGALLTGYNAFIADAEDGHSASDHIAEYLTLDIAEREQKEMVDDQVTVPDDTPTESTTPDTAEPEASEPEAPAETPAPTPDSTESTPEPSTPATPGSAKAETVYTVKEGDTYGCIAERYYGSYEHWPDVVASNPGTEGYTEYELHVGARIVLPAISADQLKPASTLCQ